MDRARGTRSKRAALWLAAGVIPAADFYLLECYTHNPFATMGVKPQLCNLLFFELAFLFFLFVTGRAGAALTVTSAASLAVGLGNGYVMRLRGNPVVPWDIFSLKTAMGVAGNYSFRPDARMVVVTLGFCVLLAAGILMGRVWDAKVGLRRPIRFGAALGVLAGMVVFARWVQPERNHARLGLYDALFTPVAMAQKDGFAVSFLIDLQYLLVEKPRGYDAGTQERLLRQYAAEEMTQKSYMTDASELYPDVVVVMDEAFSDMGVLGGMECSEDVMPFLHRMQGEDADNVVTGYLNVSVWGGNTANTEFEFLTGHTMAYLPAGSVPYQQYLRRPIPTLVSHLKGLGYTATALHPYYAGGWNRETVYGEYMGFDRMLFLDEFAGAERIRKYVCDSACYEKVRGILGQDAQAPQFVFVVTMQNHGSYTKEYDNFTPDITVEASASTVLSRYLSLVRCSDEALMELLRGLEERERRTVVLFFGDHQPGSPIASPVLRLSGRTLQTISEEERSVLYEVPYLIWANFPLDKEEAGFARNDGGSAPQGLLTPNDMSVNYMSGRLLSAAGIPLSPYQRFLQEIEALYPVISAVRAVPGESGASPETLASYRKMQYYYLLDAASPE